MNEYDNVMQLLRAFPGERECVERLAAIRWPDGVVCPWCRSKRGFNRVTKQHEYKCYDCLKVFSVRKGTVFEHSRLPLQKWFLAIWLYSEHRKGISSVQLARGIGVTQKTAWHVLGRLRSASANMTTGLLGGVVEADETYIGGKERNKRDSRKNKNGRGTKGKVAVAGLRERDGNVKAALIDDASRGSLIPFVAANVAAGSVVCTDEWRGYNGLAAAYDHRRVAHSSGVYVDGLAHTNGIEDFWSLVKRSYVGVYHWWSEKRLHRYVAEHVSRFNLGGLPGQYRVDGMLAASVGVTLPYAELTA